MMRITPPTWRELCAGLLHLLYPNLCVGCEQDLPGSGHCFCLSCRRKLHPTDMHLSQSNAFTERFWGRLPIVTGSALYYFNRKSPIQKALHRLKYQNQADIGIRLGNVFGRLLKQSPYYQELEGIVPVPLHPKKERLRGYNQSAMLAKGLADALQIPVMTNVLIRTAYSESQTRKKRMARFDNVQEVFAVQHPDRIRGKHLLLVDDVLTTGATLEACGSALLDIPSVRLSMATIAVAVH